MYLLLCIMNKDVHFNPGRPVRIYKRVSLTGQQLAADTDLLIKFRVFLRDRPGSLAAFSSVIADAGGNISFFHYDRSVDSSRVVVEIRMKTEAALEALLRT